MREMYPDQPFYVGQAGTYAPFGRDFVNEMLEEEALDVADACGYDAADNWPPVIDHERAKEANAKIAAILKELCGECAVFPIESAERVEAN